jgi:hypothetical protein
VRACESGQVGVSTGKEMLPRGEGFEMDPKHRLRRIYSCAVLCPHREVEEPRCLLLATLRSARGKGNTTCQHDYCSTSRTIPCAILNTAQSSASCVLVAEDRTTHGTFVLSPTRRRNRCRGCVSLLHADPRLTKDGSILSLRLKRHTGFCYRTPSKRRYLTIPWTSFRNAQVSR